MHSTEKSIRQTYQIEVQYKQLSDEEADIRKRAIAQVLLAATRRQEGIKETVEEGL